MKISQRCLEGTAYVKASRAATRTHQTAAHVQAASDWCCASPASRQRAATRHEQVRVELPKFNTCSMRGRSRDPFSGLEIPADVLVELASDRKHVGVHSMVRT